MEWEDTYTSKTFDQACSAYDVTKIKEIKNRKKYIDVKKVYISTLSRTYETASALFDCMEFDMTDLLNEVPLRSFKDTDKEYPYKKWCFRGRLQWLFNRPRQPEGRRKTKRRAKKAVEMIERKEKDCFVVTHGFFMVTFIKVLKHRGYKISQKENMNIGNLEEVIAYK